MIYLINIILFAVVIYFAYKNYTLSKKKVIEEVDKEFLRLPISKYETPKWEEFDPEHTLLKDVLESIKIEDWSNTIEAEKKKRTLVLFFYIKSFLFLLLLSIHLLS